MYCTVQYILYMLLDVVAMFFDDIVAVLFHVVLVSINDSCRSVG
jgi:hypothetical protein